MIFPWQCPSSCRCTRQPIDGGERVFWRVGACLAKQVITSQGTLAPLRTHPHTSKQPVFLSLQKQQVQLVLKGLRSIQTKTKQNKKNTRIAKRDINNNNNNNKNDLSSRIVSFCLLDSMYSPAHQRNAGRLGRMRNGGSARFAAMSLTDGAIRRKNEHNQSRES